MSKQFFFNQFTILTDNRNLPPYAHDAQNKKYYANKDGTTRYENYVAIYNNYVAK